MRTEGYRPQPTSFRIHTKASKLSCAFCFCRLPAWPLCVHTQRWHLPSRSTLHRHPLPMHFLMTSLPVQVLTCHCAYAAHVCFRNAAHESSMPAMQLVVSIAMQSSVQTMIDGLDIAKQQARECSSYGSVNGHQWYFHLCNAIFRVQQA